MGHRGGPRERDALQSHVRKEGRPDRVIALHWKAVRPVVHDLAELDLPFVLIAHAKEVSSRLGWVQRVRLGRVLRAAGSIACVSGYTQLELQQRLHVPEARTRVIHPGVDPERFQPRPPDEALLRRLGIASRPLLLTVARLVERKGHDQVIRALPRLAARYAGIRYVVCGSGEARVEARLRRLARDLGVADRMVWTGSLSDAEVVELYRACDVVVMASRTLERTGDAEGFGITFLEAAACEKPVVAGAEGGVGDAVLDGRTGFLVDPHNSMAIAAKIDRLLEDPELCARMGKAGRQRVLAEFTWPGVARRLLEPWTPPR